MFDDTLQFWWHCLLLIRWAICCWCPGVMCSGTSVTLVLIYGLLALFITPHRTISSIIRQPDTARVGVESVKYGSGQTRGQYRDTAYSFIPLWWRHNGHAMASQFTSLTIVYSTVYSGARKENIKAPRHWPLCGEFTGDRWIPCTYDQ